MSKESGLCIQNVVNKATSKLTPSLKDTHGVVYPVLCWGDSESTLFYELNFVEHAALLSGCTGLCVCVWGGGCASYPPLERIRPRVQEERGGSLAQTTGGALSLRTAWSLSEKPCGSLSAAIPQGTQGFRGLEPHCKHTRTHKKGKRSDD